MHAYCLKARGEISLRSLKCVIVVSVDADRGREWRNMSPVYLSTRKHEPDAASERRVVGVPARSCLLRGGSAPNRVTLKAIEVSIGAAIFGGLSSLRLK